jgi:hypothetical protein
MPCKSADGRALSVGVVLVVRVRDTSMMRLSIRLRRFGRQRYVMAACDDAVVVLKERYHSWMAKRMKYPIDNIPFPTRGVLLTRAKRAAAMEAALASMAAEGLLPGWRFPVAVAPKTTKKR